MKKPLSLLLVLATAGLAAAQQAPFAQQDVSISSHDRVYSADQTSNTVSVIDPSNNRLLGVIRLGDPVPAALSQLYRGALLVHGLGYSPDGKTLAVVSVGSNSVTLIDTSTNSVKGVVYVGRAPHEAFFTPDARELWVTVRGEDYVSVIDPMAMRETLRVQLANGPGMTIFAPDGKYGFVCSSFTPELAVVEVQAHSVVQRLAQASPFCPNIVVSPENDEAMERVVMHGNPARVHDLIRRREPIALTVDAPVPSGRRLASRRMARCCSTLAWSRAVFRASRTDSLLTPVDDYRHRVPALLSPQQPIALSWARNPLIGSDLSPMTRGDVRDGTGFALMLRCLRLDGSGRWARLGRGARPA